MSFQFQKYIGNFEELEELGKDLVNLVLDLKNNELQIKTLVQHIKKEKYLRQLENLGKPQKKKLKEIDSFKEILHHKIEINEQRQKHFIYTIEPFENELNYMNKSYDILSSVQISISASLQMISLIKRIYDRMQENKQHL